jgi:hypothetical protein
LKKCHVVAVVCIIVFAAVYKLATWHNFSGRPNIATECTTSYGGIATGDFSEFVQTEAETCGQAALAFFLSGVGFRETEKSIINETRTVTISMSKGVSDKIPYKPYDQGQAYLIPPRIDELIPVNHLVRLVSEVIDGMEIERLLRKYRTGGGVSRYHPEMMTKLFVYGYMTKVCSSRMLAKAVRENVMFRTKVRCG